MDKINKIVLVTGAGGFIGFYLCQALLNKGYKVIGVDLTNSKVMSDLAQNKNFKVATADVKDFNSILKIFKEYKPQAVFHMAAVLPQESEDENPFLFFDVNVRGTINIFEACRLAGVKKVIYSSSMSVYGKDIKYLPVDENHPANPSSFYGLSKLQGEEIAAVYNKKYGISAIILRYGGAQGMGRQRGAAALFIKNAIAGTPIHVFHNMSWDLVWIEDIVKANISALEKINKLKFQVINIGSGKETGLKDLAYKIVKITNSKSKIELDYDKKVPKNRFFMDIKKAKKLLIYKPADPQVSLLKYINFLKEKEGA